MRSFAKRSFSFVMRPGFALPLSVALHAVLAFSLFAHRTKPSASQVTTFAIVAGEARQSPSTDAAAKPAESPLQSPPARARVAHVAARPHPVRSAPAVDDSDESAGDAATNVEVADGSLDSGGDVVVSPAALVSGSCTETLDYPAIAMKSGQEGTVRMLVSIDEEGHVLQAKLTRHVGFGLDEAALTAVKTHCRFMPARDADGHAVPALVEHLFAFRLVSTAQ